MYVKLFEDEDEWAINFNIPFIFTNQKKKECKFWENSVVILCWTGAIPSNTINEQHIGYFTPKSELSQDKNCWVGNQMQYVVTIIIIFLFIIYIIYIYNYSACIQFICFLLYLK